jgi:hypothetical protein
LGTLIISGNLAGWDHRHTQSTASALEFRGFAPHLILTAPCLAHLKTGITHLSGSTIQVASLYQEVKTIVSDWEGESVCVQAPLFLVYAPCR